MTYPIVLASASPRRRKILDELDLAYQTLIPEVEEVHWNDRPADTVIENARRKYDWARERCKDAAIITADTVVVFEGNTLGKPQDHAEARNFLKQFSGKRQQVYTGIAMGLPGLDQPELVTAISEVHFKQLSDDEIEAYLALINPLDKAGGYDIDQYGHIVIENHTGEWTNIMGLPKSVVSSWIRQHHLHA